MAPRGGPTRLGRGYSLVHERSNLTLNRRISKRRPCDPESLAESRVEVWHGLTFLQEEEDEAVEEVDRRMLDGLVPLRERAAQVAALHTHPPWSPSFPVHLAVAKCIAPTGDPSWVQCVSR